MQGRCTFERWLEAAERGRSQARAASARAVHAPNGRMAAKFEREAELHLRAAACYEDTARATFETAELELAITRGMIMTLQ